MARNLLDSIELLASASRLFAEKCVDGIEANLGAENADTFHRDLHKDLKADFILANPPFMTPKGGVVPHTRFRVPAKKSEVLFTDYIAEHLSAALREFSRQVPEAKDWVVEGTAEPE